MKFGKKMDIRDRLHSTVFDLTGNNGRILHPEIQSVGSTPADRERVIAYNMKDGDYVGGARDAARPRRAARRTR
jgi:hypothetical protein